MEAQLKKCIEQFFTSTPEACADFSRIVNERHTLRLAAFDSPIDFHFLHAFRLLDDSSIKIVHGGQFDVSKKYIAPTILRAEPNSKCMQSEIFGPILPILVVPSVSLNMISTINNCQSLTLLWNTLMSTTSRSPFIFSPKTVPSNKRSPFQLFPCFPIPVLGLELDFVRWCWN